MKQIFKLFLIASVALPLICGCGGSKKASSPKTLVAYFSATGTTGYVASDLAGIVGGDLFQIKPEVPYTEADLDWRNPESRSSLEMKDPSARTPFVGELADADSYDMIYIGFPIWWNTAPTIINTFIEKYGFKGKTVVLFATSGSSTLDNAVKVFREAYPDINWKDGRTLNGTSLDEMRTWTESLAQ